MPAMPNWSVATAATIRTTPPRPNAGEVGPDPARTRQAGVGWVTAAGPADQGGGVVGKEEQGEADAEDGQRPGESDDGDDCEGQQWLG
jgi:hypothetical protein